MHIIGAAAEWPEADCPDWLRCAQKRKSAGEWPLARASCVRAAARMHELTVVQIPAAASRVATSMTVNVSVYGNAPSSVYRKLQSLMAVYVRRRRQDNATRCGGKV